MRRNIIRLIGLRALKNRMREWAAARGERFPPMIYGSRTTRNADCAPISGAWRKRVLTAGCEWKLCDKVIHVTQKMMQLHVETWGTLCKLHRCTLGPATRVLHVPPRCPPHHPLYPPCALCKYRRWIILNNSSTKKDPEFKRKLRRVRQGQMAKYRKNQRLNKIMRVMFTPDTSLQEAFRVLLIRKSSCFEQGADFVWYNRLYHGMYQEEILKGQGHLKHTLHALYCYRIPKQDRRERKRQMMNKNYMKQRSQRVSSMRIHINESLSELQ